MLELLVEAWIWYAVVVLVALSRFVSRRMTFGSFKKFQTDDYLMVVALCFYTVLIPVINIVRDHDSNLLPPHFDVDSLTRNDVRERAFGSKLVLVTEQCQCVTVWLAKACLLILYLRLTTMRKEHIVVVALFCYVVGSFVIMDILYFGVWCRPFSNYWAVPTPNPQCDAATNHLITNAVFNISSDALMLVVGLPLFLRLKLPMRKKAPVICVFSLGIFTVLAAILNKVYSFNQPFGREWTYWYVRESSTAMLVANLPFVWTLWRRVTGFEKSVQGVSRQTSRTMGGDGTFGTIVDGDGSRRASTKKSFSGWFRRSTNSDLELDSQQGLQVEDEQGPEMSAQDFFISNTPRLSEGAEPNPITHPHLFYSRQKQRGNNAPQTPLEPAILRERIEEDTIRRSNQQDGTPPSSALPSLTSSVTHKSTEAYV